MSAHPIAPEDGDIELAVEEAAHEPEVTKKDPSPSRHRFLGLLGLGSILLIMVLTLYFALRYMI